MQELIIFSLKFPSSYTSQFISRYNVNVSCNCYLNIFFVSILFCVFVLDFQLRNLQYHFFYKKKIDTPCARRVVMISRKCVCVMRCDFRTKINTEKKTSTKLPHVRFTNFTNYMVSTSESL